MKEDGVSSRSDNLRRHKKRGKKKSRKRLGELRVRLGWIEREIVMERVDVEGAECRKGYPHNTAKQERGWQGEGQRRDVNGKRETPSSAAVDDSGPPHFLSHSFTLIVFT